MIENLLTGTVFFYDLFFYFLNLFDIFGLYMSYEAQIYFKNIFQNSSRLYFHLNPLPGPLCIAQRILE